MAATEIEIKDIEDSLNKIENGTPHYDGKTHVLVIIARLLLIMVRE